MDFPCSACCDCRMRLVFAVSDRRRTRKVNRGLGPPPPSPLPSPPPVSLPRSPRSALHQTFPKLLSLKGNLVYLTSLIDYPQFDYFCRKIYRCLNFRHRARNIPDVGSAKTRKIRLVSPFSLRMRRVNIEHFPGRTFVSVIKI